MCSVTELGYLGLNVTNIDAWKTFARELVGAEWIAKNDNTHLIRIDDWHHRIALHQHGSEDALAYIGWRVAAISALENISRRPS